MNLFAEGVETLAGSRKPDGKDLAGHLPGLFRDVFRNAFLKFRDGRILTLFLTELNGFEYSHSEELGNAFEYLLLCMGTQGENGQFRTPRHIIDFMVRCLDPQPQEKTLDPACGTGGFLVSAYRHILAWHTSGCGTGVSPVSASDHGRDARATTIPGDLMTHAQRQSLYRNLAGYDITDLMVKLSKVNLFLHGFPDPAIHIYDTLSNDARWHEKADVILANPPFMTPKGGVTPHTKFRIAAKKAEVLFTDYIAEHLTPDGRGGVIVPNGIVATTQNAYVKLRRFLVADSLIAVVSLPAGVFKPYSGVKTSILFFDKRLARQRPEILFLKITADGFDLGDKRTPIAADDLPEAERVVKAWFAGKLRGTSPEKLTAKLTEKLTNTNSASQGQRPALSQPGATPQESNPQNKLKGQRPDRSDRGAPPHDPIPNDTAGPTARPIASAKHGSGLQPSKSLPKPVPGALPQAEMDCTVGATVAWTTVERSELLAHSSTSLSAERFFGEDEIIDAIHPRTKLGDVLSFVGSGVTPKGGKSTYLTSGIRFIRSQNVLWGSCDFSDIAFISDETHAEMNRTAVKQWDIFLNITGASIGRSAIYTDTAPANVNQHVTILRPTETLLPEFLCRCLISEGCQSQIRTIQSGASREALNYQQIKELEIPLPPLEEQRRIVAEIEGYQKDIDRLESEIATNRERIQRVLDRVWGNSNNDGSS